MKIAKLAVAGAALLMVTGCGTDVGFTPGAAATVGDKVVSLKDVEALATGSCKAFAPGIAAQGTPIALSSLSNQILRFLTLKAAAEQLAEEHAVEPGLLYEQSVKDLETQAVTFPEDGREEVVAVQSAIAYVGAIESAVGAKLLADEGVTGEAATDEAKAARGTDALAAWLGANPAKVNPRFPISINLTDLAPIDTSVSYPVSDAAVAALASEPDAAYIDTLPASQVCGG